MTRMDYRFDGSPLTETTVDSASDTAALVAGGRHLRRAYDSSGRLWTMEAAWGEILPEAASTGGSSTLSPRVVFSYGAADRLAAIQSGGFTGAVTRTAAQESFSVTASATHQAEGAAGVLAACQRLGVRVFASSATLSGCADASCGSTSSR